MTDYGSMLRPIASRAARSTAESLSEFGRPRSFALPSDPDATGLRVVRNLIYFRLSYCVFLYVVLLVTLVPRRPTAMVCLMATSTVAASYGVLLRAFPNSALLRFLDRHMSTLLFLILIVVQLVLTRAVVHLLATIAVGLPIVFVHAMFRTRDDLVAEEQSVDKKDADLEMATQ